MLLVEKQGFPVFFIANIASNVFFTSYVAYYCLYFYKHTDAQKEV